ncbi:MULTISPECIES: spore coat protein GerQ [Bacillus]|uniref:spore coat protein GerQ n=1 Tax=Bacillus TaxID=1386 RepID=UPI002E1AD709|nr:spore coat protein GerQ [Bacillus smithii]MED1456526.1 spore coat protein GerQ [Bacillus smithii]MED1489663.1 spore coat protein GerQ [Bacillus smithii]
MRQQPSGNQQVYYTYPQGYPAQAVQPSPYPHVPFYPGASQQQQQVGGAAPSQQTPTSVAQYIPGMLPLEQSYIENILRLNKGKLVTVYMTFENNREWNAKIFKGVIEAAGRDHLIISDPQTGTRYLLPMVYVDYITFEEPIEYEYPFAGGGGGPGGSYQPR